MMHPQAKNTKPFKPIPVNPARTCRLAVPGMLEGP